MIGAPGIWAGVNDSFLIARQREQEQMHLAGERQRQERAAWDFQTAQEDRQRQMRARAGAGRTLYGMMPPPVQSQPVPQTPMPGTPSAPMQPPGGGGQRMMAPGVPQFGGQPPQGPPPGMAAPQGAGGPPPGMRGAPTQPDERQMAIARCQRDLQALEREMSRPGLTPDQKMILTGEKAKTQDQLAKLTGQPAPYRALPQPDAPGVGAQGAPGGPSPAGPMAPPPVGGAPQSLLMQIISRAKADGVPPDELMDVVDTLNPVLKNQLQEELAAMRGTQLAQTVEFKTLKLQLDQMEHDRRVKRDEKLGDQGDRKLDQNAERIKLAKDKAAAGQAPTKSELDDPQVAEYWYDLYKKGGDKPPFAWGKAGEADRQAWMRFLASKGEAGEVVAGRAEAKGRTSALAANEKRNTGLDVGARETLADMQTLNGLLDTAAAKGGSRLLNTPINKLRSLGSDPEYGKLELASKQVATKYERMLSGGILSISQMHEGAREDSKRILNGDMTVAEVRAKLPLMIREMQNAQKSGKDTSKALRNEIAGNGGDDEDAQAIAWAKANPKDDRAKQILKLHGM